MVSGDELRRARQPMVEAHDNALKSNAGWLSLVDRAQTEADRIDRYLRAGERLAALGPQDVRDAALKYLDPASAVEIVVLPKDAAPSP